MSKVVIDTNVLLVANGQHEDVGPDCIKACVLKLLEARQGVVIIDDGYRILSEYQNKTKTNSATRVGDAFLKWLHQNKTNQKRVEQVVLTETAKDEFVEFPDPALQPAFDAPDRKFAAVSNASPTKPPIVQAADCKWLNWWPQLSAKGVQVDFICKDDVCRFYRQKFPGTSVPKLP
tara:strand:- start:3493 stop:4020 length:528 start_codon:yes stop_codon:yes gene_type:complete